ncbi:unnamed protein product [Lathyrus sativus]|nr:unnamed protein product [Lathyrus sativus]
MKLHLKPVASPASKIIVKWVYCGIMQALYCAVVGLLMPSIVHVTAGVRSKSVTLLPLLQVTCCLGLKP